MMDPRGQSPDLCPCHPEAVVRPAAMDYPDETGSRGGGGKGVSHEDDVPSADERKRTTIGYGGIARRRSFGDDKWRRWSTVTAFSLLA